MKQLQVVFVDFLKSRTDRQLLNNLKVYNSIKNKDITEFKNVINRLELKRTLDYLSVDFKSFWASDSCDISN